MKYIKGINESVRKINGGYECSNCGLVLRENYGANGGINHDNNTNDFNMEVFVNRFKEDKEDAWTEAMQLDDNLCNLEGINYKSVMEVYDCKTQWLNRNGYKKIAKFLLDRRDLVKGEVNKTIDAIIAEKRDEFEDSIKYLEKNKG